MKRIYKAAVFFTLLISFNSIKAQIVTERRPQLFAAFAKTINFPKTELEKIFTTPEGRTIKLSLGENVGFTGIITSSIQRYHNLQSVVVRLNNLDGTVFGISKRTNDDNSITYIGRIINTKYADAFELKTDATGNYFINKTKTADLIEDHE
jgi:ribosomal protein S4E